MNDVREKAVVAPGMALLVVALACSVGEAPAPGPVPAGRGAEVSDTMGPEGALADSTADAAAAYRATDLLIQAQLAYEEARLDSSLMLVDQVLADYPESMAVAPARWVGARAAFALGRYERARELAEQYADRQPEESTLGTRARELARLAEDALAAPSAETPVIGVVLPRSGPRVLVRYADWVLEGIRLAVDRAERQQGRSIELVVADDSGGARTRAAVQELEARGALAIVGPLMPRQVAPAAEARRDSRLVMVSPTAAAAPAWPRTYTVRPGDSRGAQQLGRFAADVGFRQAALLYARGSEYERKAEAFAVEYGALGGDVKAMVPYDSGTTTFGPYMNEILDAVAPGDTVVTGVWVDSLIALGFLPDRAAADSMARDTLLMMVDMLRPEGASGAADGLQDRAGADTDADAWLGQPGQQPFALFISGPPQDVPKIAPQVAFYDLDSAGVQVLGDEAWAAADVRRVTPHRDLEGVIVASPFPPGAGDGVADSAFVGAYEARYRRSLENQLPALGYDAANLVLQALPNRMLTPDALSRRFGFLAGIHGATGELSVRAGKVVRRPYLMVIHNGELESAPLPWEYQMPEPVPPTPDSSGADAGRRGGSVR